MTRRMIDAGIWANEHFAMLPPMARLLQIGIINMADDQGRMKAHPAYLRSQVFPYDDVLVEDVQSWLDLIAANDTLMLYEVDGKTYLQLLNWWQYQSPAFASPSQYPRSAGWQDHIRYTGKNRTIYTCNWSTSSGDLLPDTCDQDGNPLPKGGQPRGEPYGQPGGQPRGEPGTPLIEDKDKYKKEIKAAATPAAAASDPPESSDSPAWQAYRENINPDPPPMEIAQVDGLIAQHGERDMLKAIAIAVKRKRCTLGYVEGILQRGVDSKPPKGVSNGTYSRDDGPLVEPVELDPEIVRTLAENRARLVAESAGQGA